MVRARRVRAKLLFQRVGLSRQLAGWVRLCQRVHRGLHIDQLVTELLGQVWPDALWGDRLPFDRRSHLVLSADDSHPAPHQSYEQGLARFRKPVFSI
jgi:hypothetical protein